MQPKIEILTEKKLVARSIRMSLVKDRTAELWRSFMPLRKEIENTIGTALYSLQIYDEAFDFENFAP